MRLPFFLCLCITHCFFLSAAEEVHTVCVNIRSANNQSYFIFFDGYNYKHLKTIACSQTEDTNSIASPHDCVKQDEVILNTEATPIPSEYTIHPTLDGNELNKCNYLITAKQGSFLAYLLTEQEFLKQLCQAGRENGVLEGYQQGFIQGYKSTQEKLEQNS